jgi:hypothetical protein
MQADFIPDPRQWSPTAACQSVTAPSLPCGFLLTNNSNAGLKEWRLVTERTFGAR